MYSVDIWQMMEMVQVPKGLVCNRIVGRRETLPAKDANSLSTCRQWKRIRGNPDAVAAVDAGIQVGVHPSGSRPRPRPTSSRRRFRETPGNDLRGVPVGNGLASFNRSTVTHGPNHDARLPVVDRIERNDNEWGQDLSNLG